jgi:hypothetical protein
MLIALAVVIGGANLALAVWAAIRVNRGLKFERPVAWPEWAARMFTLWARFFVFVIVIAAVMAPLTLVFVLLIA